MRMVGRREVYLVLSLIWTPRETAYTIICAKGSDLLQEGVPEVSNGLSRLAARECCIVAVEQHSDIGHVFRQEVA
jgi:hypothetical protein